MEKRDYVNLAIDLYGEAGKAAGIIQRHLDLLSRTEGNDDLKEKEYNKIDSLIYHLKQRALLTDIPADQRTERIEKVKAEIEHGNYDEAHSETMRQKNCRANQAKEAIVAHPKYGELVQLLREHNQAGGYQDDVLEEALNMKDALNYSGEIFTDLERSKYRCSKLTKHNGKIRKLQAAIAWDLRLTPIISQTWKGQKVVKGYNLSSYWKLPEVIEMAA